MTMVPPRLRRLLELIPGGNSITGTPDHRTGRSYQSPADVGELHSGRVNEN